MSTKSYISLGVLAFLAVCYVSFQGPTLDDARRLGMELVRNPHIRGIIVNFNESTTPTNTDIPTVSLPPKCNGITKHLLQRELPGGGMISYKTRCPNSDAWLSDYLEDYPKTNQEKFVFLNFGCNKGYDSLRVAQAITHNHEVFNKDKWRIGLGIDHPGVCGQANEKNPNTFNNTNESTSVPRQVEVHCVEAMPMTYEALDSAAKATKADQNGLTVHNYAMTGLGGGNTTLFPNILAGKEDLGMDACQVPRFKDRCVEVPSSTVDEFVTKHVDRNYGSATVAAGNAKRLPYVSIDVEGFDFTIMKASQQTLKRTDYLEFEFHGVGDWGRQNLTDAIDMLHDVGLFCYWAGQNKLWRITDCWVDAYGSFHAWSNVACVSPEYQPALAETMEQVFEKTIIASLPA